MNRPTWESAEQAQRYRSLSDMVIPGRQEILSVIARCAARFTSARPRIMDIGCGYGEAAAAVLEQKPDCSVTLLDFNDEMLRMAGERFQHIPHASITKHNLDEGLPPDMEDESYDAVISCFALHHVAFERRLPLYRDIHHVLKSGGIFINGDRFTGESPALAGWQFDNWISWMVESIREKTGKVRGFDQIKERQLESDNRLGDKPGTIWTMREELKSAGFSHADCLWMYLDLGVLAAVK